MVNHRTIAATAGVFALVVAGAAACGSSGSTPSAESSSGGGSSGSSSANVPQLSATSFTRDFSAMAKLKPLAKAGKGSIGVILPDTTSSARYTEFDAPYFKKSFEKAGLDSSQYSIQNAHGSDSTFVTDAKADITNGASVLVTDPEDSGTGAQVEKYAKQHGVTVVDYDRLTLGGNRDYYISFNNVKVGKLIGNGFADCTTAWGVKKPVLIEMKGDPTDNNAKLFAQGYESVIKQHSDWKVAATPAGTWTPKTAQTEFVQSLTAHKNVNSAIIPNDENAAPIISYLKNQGIKPKTFPITGQDATLVGLQNILDSYQCGTAYKPIYLETQAAAAVALYARAGKTPPSGLVNGTTQDSKENKAVKSVLLKPEWVTTKNMNDTVVADQFVPAKQLCKGHAKECKAAGISG